MARIIGHKYDLLSFQGVSHRGKESEASLHESAQHEFAKLSTYWMYAIGGTTKLSYLPTLV